MLNIQRSVTLLNFSKKRLCFCILRERVNYQSALSSCSLCLPLRMFSLRKKLNYQKSLCTWIFSLGCDENSQYSSNPHTWWFEDGHHRIHSKCEPCYTLTRPSRTQFGVSINVWRLAGDRLNINCNFLYCNHQVHRDFLITLHYRLYCRL
jgi:hypothetical protein